MSWCLSVFCLGRKICRSRVPDLEGSAFRGPRSRVYRPSDVQRGELVLFGVNLQECFYSEKAFSRMLIAKFLGANRANSRNGRSFNERRLSQLKDSDDSAMHADNFLVQ